MTGLHVFTAMTIIEPPSVRAERNISDEVKIYKPNDTQFDILNALCRGNNVYYNILGDYNLSLIAE